MIRAHEFMLKFRLKILFFIVNVLTFVDTAYTQNLPSLGDRISGTVSLEQEYSMGQQFLAQIRRTTSTIPDPLLMSYFCLLYTSPSPRDS